MAAKSSLLSDVMNLDAKDANRKILRRYVEMTMPSLAAGLEGLEDEMNRVEELPGRYPTPSVTSQRFKTLLPVENPAFFHFTFRLWPTNLVYLRVYLKIIRR